MKNDPMMSTRRTTIFRQLIFNIAIPTLLALLVIAILNFVRTRSILESAATEKNKLLSSEITKILKFQDIAFDLIEEELNMRMKSLNNLLVNEYFNKNTNPETCDLFKIAKSLGMDPGNEDIYIINREGVVVNTTFRNDYNVNLFSFGEQFRTYLQNIFDTGDLIVDLFATEASTKRPKKYSYLATRDKKYIVELGFYSRKADEIIRIMEETKKEIKNESKGIVDIELFLMADRPFSMNRDALEVKGQENALLSAFQKKDTTTFC
jgi:hypothetical protein